MTYCMRNDFVLVRKSKVETVRRLAMPESSAEGTAFHVVDCGPDVTGLTVGDRVMLMGRGDETYYPVPGEPDLLVVKQHLVAYIIQE